MRRPRRNSAMLSRTEFEPISTAAKTGMVYQARWAEVRSGWAVLGGFFAAGTAAEVNNVVMAETAADCRAAKSARTSRKRAQLDRKSTRLNSSHANISYA